MPFRTDAGGNLDAELWTEAAQHQVHRPGQGPGTPHFSIDEAADMSRTAAKYPTPGAAHAKVRDDSKLSFGGSKETLALFPAHAPGAA